MRETLGGGGGWGGERDLANRRDNIFFGYSADIGLGVRPRIRLSDSIPIASQHFRSLDLVSW